MPKLKKRPTKVERRELNKIVKRVETLSNSMGEKAYLGREPKGTPFVNPELKKRQEEAMGRTKAKKLDADDWISQRCESMEGPTVEEFLHYYNKSSRKVALRTFRKFEEERLIFRSDMFCNRERVWTDQEPIPPVVTDESRLFHDLYEHLLVSSKTTKAGARLNVIMKALEELHPTASKRDVLRLLFRLHATGVIEDIKDPLKNMYQLKGVYEIEDPDDFDEWLSDSGVYENLKNPSYGDFKIWLGHANGKLELEEAQEQLQREKEEPTKPEPLDTEDLTDEGEDVAGMPEAQPAEITPATPSVVGKTPGELVEALFPKAHTVNTSDPIGPTTSEKPAAAPEPVVPITVPQPQGMIVNGLSWLDALITAQTTVNAPPENIRRMAAIGSNLADLGKHFTGIGECMQRLSKDLDKWGDDDVSKVL